LSKPTCSNNFNYHFLNVPGYRNSGKEHWQTIWESLYPEHFTRVQQESWEYPDPDSWVNTIHKFASGILEPIIIVAHSLGCIAAVRYAVQYQPKNIAGAFLVAPADADKSENPVINEFAPVPTKRLPFPSVVVASTNDPFAAIGRQANYAAYWGSKFICIGDRGHINADSKLEEWKEGWDILQEQFSIKTKADIFNPVENYLLKKII